MDQAIVDVAPTDGLVEAFDALGWSGRFPNLAAAHVFSSDLVARARAHVADLRLPDSIDVLALGSLGRFETSLESDLDGLVVDYAPEATFSEAEATELLKELGGLLDLRPPGRTGLFGGVISTRDLFEIIGLDHDTNQRHSRRVLVLEESVSLRSPERHADLLRTMVNRYIDAIPPSRSNVPRFLVNDLARYWRQLTVDYQAKSEQSDQSALRRLKLMVTRKFTYAASVLPILTHELRGSDRESLVNGLVNAYQRPASARFVEEVRALSEQPDGDTVVNHAYAVLQTVDAFNALLSSADWRATLANAATRDDAEELPEFAEGRALARSLQRDLDELFFCSTLQPLTRKYLVF
ncbi:hypothetical protein BH10ACT5_BH10ACT5_05550 [soil metagenome]